VRLARCLLALAVLTAGLARAAPGIEPPASPVEELRDAYKRGDYVTVRKKLLELYALEPKPELLFALGQVELNLGHYQAAIDYYEKFIATQPSDDQVALAQQAIGAARMRLAHPDRPPQVIVEKVPAPPEHPPEQPRRWSTEDTGFVALGGAAVLVGAGLLYYAHTLGEDRSGSLSAYDMRVEQSRTTKWTGIGIAAAGTVVIAIPLVRWQW
jgi:tetratricopeptide (TPR) repeat protein